MGSCCFKKLFSKVAAKGSNPFTSIKVFIFFFDHIYETYWRKRGGGIEDPSLTLMSL